MHWGNIGSMVAGASALIIAIAALIRSPAALRDWRTRQRAEADAAHEERRGSGWNGDGTWPDGHLMG